MQYTVALRENWNRGSGILVPRECVKEKVEATSKAEAIKKAISQRSEKDSVWTYTYCYIED